MKRENIRNEKTAAEEEYEAIKRFIAQDNEWRETVARLEKEKQDADDEKVKEKSDMDEAARFIQRKWNWFQTVGKFLAKKKRKGGKKGGKKKKK